MRWSREESVIGGRRNGRVAISLLALATFWLLAPSASAAPILLNVLEGQTTDIGDISIEWTKVEGTGDIDLSQVAMEMASDANGLGFDLVPIGDGMKASYPSVFDIKLEFTVSSSVPLVSVGNYLMAETTLTAETTGGYWVQAFETVAEDASVTATAYHSLAFSDPIGVDSLATPLTELTIVKNIIVNYNPADTDAGDFGRIDLLSQRFQAVPEPGSAVLVLCGFLGLALGSRTRGSDPHECAQTR